MKTVFHPAHPHHKVFKAYVEGCFANPDNPPVVEFLDSYEKLWTEIGKPSWEKVYQYRLTPRTVKKTVTYHEPLRVAPLLGSQVWVVSSENDSPYRTTWTDAAFLVTAIKNGMCFATEADAQACYDALFGEQK